METVIGCTFLLYLLHLLIGSGRGMLSGIKILAFCRVFSRLVGKGILACLCFSGLLVNRRK